MQKFMILKTSRGEKPRLLEAGLDHVNEALAHPIGDRWNWAPVYGTAGVCHSRSLGLGF